MELENTIQNILDKLESWAAIALVNVPNFLLAVIVIVLFALIAKYGRKLTQKITARAGMNLAVRKLVANLAYMVFLLIGVFIALTLLNLDKTVTSLLAGAGIIGLALSFAFQDAAANFISGLFLIINRPIKIGDQVETNGFHGIVKNISIRSTIIETFQGKVITIPNRLIFENPIENISTNGSRRIDLEVGIAYDENLDKVEEVAKNALVGLESVLQDRPVKLIYTSFGGSSINFKLLYWCSVNSEPGYLQALTDGIKAVKAAFGKADINIPFPIRTLDLGLHQDLLNRLPAGGESPKG